MSRVVKKFGGTSLAGQDKIEYAVEEVVRDLEKDKEVTVVVSAMGAAGDPYATDTLIDLLSDVSPEIDSRKQDLMMSCGEIISASLFAHYLDREGYPAVPMTGYSAGIYTDGNFGNAQVIDVDTARINQHTMEGKPVVLAGFQGRTVDGELTTLGRGGSDTTALVVGEKLGADIVEIYTDVPGVGVTEPDIVDQPRYFSTISRRSLLHLAENGAEVIHPPAVTRARESGTPIVIKSTWNRSNETIVEGDSVVPDHPVGIAVQHDYTMLEGDSKKINRDQTLASRAEEVFYVDGERSIALVPDENTPQKNGYRRREGVSLVTMVVTDPALTVKARQKILNSLPGESFLEKFFTDYGLKFVVSKEEHESLIRSIYDVFYEAAVPVQ